jgi:hypothetical protein
MASGSITRQAGAGDNAEDELSRARRPVPDSHVLPRGKTSVRLMQALPALS